MSGFFNLGKWIGKKSSKGGKAIDKVAPTTGSSIKETFMAKFRNKESKKIFQASDPSKDRNKASQETFKKSKGE